jgi:predicted small lipoprotein YifL
LQSILVSAGMALLLAGCGQKGPLYLPTEPSAANRATLPQSVRPAALSPAAPASAPPLTGTASPTRQP